MQRDEVAFKIRMEEETKQLQVQTKKWRHWRFLGKIGFLRGLAYLQNTSFIALPHFGHSLKFVILLTIKVLSGYTSRYTQGTSQRPRCVNLAYASSFNEKPRFYQKRGIALLSFVLQSKNKKYAKCYKTQFRH